MSDEIREIISITHRSTKTTPDDLELAKEYNQVIRMGLREAKKILRYGSSYEKLALAKVSLSAAGRLAALDSKTEIEQHRAAFEALMEAQTNVPARNMIVTASDAPIDTTAREALPNALITPIDRPADDQDDFFGDEEV